MQLEQKDCGWARAGGLLPFLHPDTRPGSRQRAFKEKAAGNGRDDCTDSVTMNGPLRPMHPQHRRDDNNTTQMVRNGHCETSDDHAVIGMAECMVDEVVMFVQSRSAITHIATAATLCMLPDLVCREAAMLGMG